MSASGLIRLLDQADQAVLVAVAPVDHARQAAALVPEQVEVVPHQFHLEQRLINADRRGGVELLPHHDRAVALHLDGHDAAWFGPVAGRAVVVLPAVGGLLARRDGAGHDRTGRARPPRPRTVAHDLPGAPPVRAAATSGPPRGPGTRLAWGAPCRALRRSPERRSRSSSLASARSSAANLSSAAASARMAGPLDRMVSSTRSRRSAWRGLRSADTSTSTLSALWSSFAILPSLAAA